MRQSDVARAMLELAVNARFEVVDSADNLTGKVGLTITALNVMYPAATAFATLTAPCTELGFGWYQPSVSTAGGMTTALQTEGVALFSLTANSSAGTNPLGFGLNMNRVYADVKQVAAEDVAAMAELSSVPSATPSMVKAMMWTYMRWRNEQTATTSAETVKNNAGSAIGTATVTDAAGTTTKGKFA